MSQLTSLATKDTVVRLCHYEDPATGILVGLADFSRIHPLMVDDKNLQRASSSARLNVLQEEGNTRLEAGGAAYAEDPLGCSFVACLPDLLRPVSDSRICLHYPTWASSTYNCCFHVHSPIAHLRRRCVPCLSQVAHTYTGACQPLLWDHSPSA